MHKNVSIFSKIQLLIFDVPTREFVQTSEKIPINVQSHLFLENGVLNVEMARLNFDMIHFLYVNIMNPFTLELKSVF